MGNRIFLKFAFFALPFILIIFFLSVYEEKLKKNSVTNKTEIMFCKDLNYEKNLLLHPENFSSNFSLGIAFESERSWKKNLLNNIIKSEENKKESDGWRNFSSKSKRYPGTIFFEIPEKFKCKIKARIRDHGDLMDQRDGSILPSLNVHLDNGHIFGITKFILFLPHTRNGANEIFASELFRSLGILSPKSVFINVKYGKTVKKFIFQEKIHKELLESNNLREAPILEGDERFAFWDKRMSQNLSKNKIVNINWSKKNKSAYKVSEYSISILNHLVQIHDTENIYYSKTDNLDYDTLGKKYFDKKIFENLDIFDSLSIAMGSDHIMPRNERRFYFDPLYKKFYPIYYDGNYKIIDGINSYTDKNDEVIIRAAKNGAAQAIKLLKNINLIKFHENLNKSGFNISLEETKNKIREINENLEKIKNYDEKRIFKIKINNLRNPHVEKNENYDQKLKRKLIFYSDIFTEYLKCDIFGDHCEKVSFEDKEKFKLLNQELIDQDGNNLIFVGKKRSGKPYENWIYKEYFKKNKVTRLSKDTKIISIGDPIFNVNKELKSIKIKKIKQTDRVVFFGGILDGWKIEMADLTDYKQLKDFGAEENNLTGCLNFYDITVQNLDLIFNDANCEDAINFVRVNGNINSMKINNSAFDGMDADFSNIKFDNVNIYKSLNDCLDFSFGKYEVKNAQIQYCGDKAISIGEVSNVEITNVNIENTNSAIASKDYAKTHISKSKISNTKYCFQAYNKKTEFAGGYIYSKNNICKFDLKLALVDQSSKILLNGKNYSTTKWMNETEGKGEYNGI